MSQSRDHRRDEMDKHRGMNRTAGFITAVVFSVVTMLFAIHAVAQVQETPATGSCCGTPAGAANERLATCFNYGVPSQRIEGHRQWEGVLRSPVCAGHKGQAEPDC